MTIRTRRRLFYGLFTAFFVLGIGVLLYVNGWRLDPKTLQLRKVGAIFVRSFPKDAKIFLDNELIENESGFFQNGTLVNDLFPKIYELRLESDNYEPWRENVSVQPALVSELKYAVLIPKNYLVVSTSTIKNFWIFDDNLVTEDGSGNLAFGNTKIGKGEILGATDDLKNILTLDPAGIYFWNNLSDGSKINISSMLKKIDFNTNKNFKIIVDAKDRQKLIILEPTAISLLNTAQANLTNIYKSGKNFLGDFAASQFLFAWTEFNETHNTSTLIIYDKFLQKRLTDTLIINGENKELRWLGNNKLAVLQKDGSLYTYSVEKKEVVKIADDVKSFEFTEDGKAIAALENSALEIFFFDQNHDYYRFNLSNVGEVEKIIWYTDSNHLFVVYPDSVKFLDLKDGALQNFTTIAKTNLVQYDEKNNWLYFLEDGELKKLEFPE